MTARLSKGQEGGTFISDETLRVLFKRMETPSDREAAASRSVASFVETQDHLFAKIRQLTEQLGTAQETISRLQKDLGDTTSKQLEVLRFEEQKRVADAALAQRSEQAKKLFAMGAQVLALAQAQAHAQAGSQPDAAAKVQGPGGLFADLTEVLESVTTLLPSIVERHQDYIIRAFYELVCRLSADERQQLLESAPAGPLARLLDLAKRAAQ